MINVFGDYAEYYDLFYHDKDYEAEVDYLCDHISKHQAGARRLLDVGCGTGAHAEKFARRDFRVYGIDQSSKMIDRARSRTEAMEGVVVEQGDIRGWRCERSFDVVTALFHVVSYQKTNEDLRDTLMSIRRHLTADGIFIFDCWYGPAVLNEEPEVRVKYREDEARKIVRVAEPILYANENLVDVRYTIFVSEDGKGVYERTEEVHTMRYLFIPELKALLKNCDLRIIDYEEWLTGAELGIGTWSALFVVGRA